MSEARDMHEGIAIIGAAGRFPGSKTIEEYWRNLCDGVECISFFSDEELLETGVRPEQLSNPNYVRARAVVQNIDQFDAEFFGFSPREAEITDPQQRLFLECAWEALESAGYNPDTHRAPIGVYAGASLSNYLFMLFSNPELVELVGNFQIEIGNDKDFLSTRTSYKLNLCGPSVNVNTACSTSLVAATLACQSLLTHQCDMALAGGVSLGIPQRIGYLYNKGGISSPDGHCRAFDAQAQGTVGGNGVGVVVLKRLEDAITDGDPVIAVIKGFAINNDGGAKVGFTAPSVEGQAAVICEAMANAGVGPETVTYVETHGTATTLGDPIEILALTRAFRFGTDKNQFCAIGSVKTNIGHLDSAAGAAGLIKAALVVKHGIIPPSLHYREPNPQIDFGNSPFYVNAQRQTWKPETGLRRAGVSSFGIGGTNAHVVLEEAPAPWTSSSSRKAQLLVLSARTKTALHQAASNLQEYLQKPGEQAILSDAAYTLAVGRKAFQQRMAVVCGSREEAIRCLDLESPAGRSLGECAGSDRPIVLLLSGQGSQYIHMGRHLYEQDRVFRAEIDRSSEYLKPLLGLDLRLVMYPEAGTEARATDLLRQTWITQPAIYVLENALLKLWESWGVKGSAMLGHSLGELVAATAAGVLSGEDGLRMAVLRGRLMWETEPGAMLGVGLSEEAALKYQRGGISLAAVNGSQQVVFSGGEKEIAGLEKELEQEGIAVQRLEVERAFHSEKLEPIREEFMAVVKGFKLNKPAKPYISNVTGKWAGAEVTEPGYWWEQMRRPVLFAAGVQHLLPAEDWLWLEVGPGEVLSRLVRHALRRAGKNSAVVASLWGKGNSDKEQKGIVQSLGKLWVNGVKVDWAGYYCEEKRRRVPLPTYPFQRQSYWAAIPKEPQPTEVKVPAEVSIKTTVRQQSEPSSLHSRPHLQASYVPPEKDMEIVLIGVWQELLGIKGIGVNDNFFDLGGHSLLLLQMVGRLREKLDIQVPLEGFIEEPTVAGLTRRIESGGNDGSKRSVIAPIRTSGTKPPLFGVHPVGGGAFLYRQLAHHLGPEQPFYGLQALGLADIGEHGDPYSSLEHMAAEYLADIRTVQPTGPYFLSGLSWGGVLAFEMAQQLTRKGEEVGLLALFDTPSPAELSKLDGLDDAEILVGLARDLGFQRGIELPLSVGEVRALTQEEQFVRVLHALQEFGLLPGEVTTGWLRRLLQGYRSRLGFVRNYVPDIYPGRITFFRAGDFDEEMMKGLDRLNMDYSSPSFAWDKLSTEPVEVFIIPGNHSEMVIEPNVQVLAEHLNACINRSITCPV